MSISSSGVVKFHHPHPPLVLSVKDATINNKSWRVRASEGGEIVSKRRFGFPSFIIESSQSKRQWGISVNVVVKCRRLALNMNHSRMPAVVRCGECRHGMQLYTWHNSWYLTELMSVYHFLVIILELCFFRMRCHRRSTVCQPRILAPLPFGVQASRVPTSCDCRKRKFSPLNVGVKASRVPT